LREFALSSDQLVFVEEVERNHIKKLASKENGRKGGLVKSRKKTLAARRNARRPRPGRRKG